MSEVATAVSEEELLNITSSVRRFSMVDGLRPEKPYRGGLHS